MEGISVGLMVLKSIGMLSIVIALLIGCLHLMKKLTPVGGKSGGVSMIRMLSAYYLSPKERVVLLSVMDRKILIGVTPQGITRIAEFEGGECEEQAEAPVQDSVFENLLSRMTRQLVSPGKTSKGTETQQV